MKNTLLTISLVLSTILASATPFITRWDLSKNGLGANQISFSDSITGTVNYTWETVPVSSNSGSGILTNFMTTITGLPTNAIIRLKIDSAHFNLFNIGANDNNRLIDVEQWGTVKWTSMSGAFNLCSNLNISATDIPNLSNVTNMGYMFAGCSNLNGPSNINTWNTSNVTNMSGMFYAATSFNQPIGNWNTNNVTDMSDMFTSAESFNQPISNWNTNNVTDMNSMFENASSFNQSIGNWNTTNVTDMSGMFLYATSFNQPIGNWNTSKVMDMAIMFEFAKSFNQPINNWNTSKVMDMNFMFLNAKSFNQPLGNWNLSQDTIMIKMLDSSGIDCHNYAATLQGWANNTATPHNLRFGAANIHYGTNVVADRNTLISTKGWTFVGDIADATACNATGINNILLTNNITLSPNPTHTTFQLSTKSPVNIQLYNTMGQMVLTTSVNSGASASSATAAATSVTEPAEVNITHLPIGLYLIKEAKTGLIIGKIMKE